jgi:ABC-2 type transport system permease protein
MAAVRLALALVENETVKLVRRRRPHLVLAVLVIFLGVSTWAQLRQQESSRRGAGSPDWRARVEQRIRDVERRAERRRIFVGVTRALRFEAARLRHHLDAGIDPNALTGPLVSRAFAAVASSVLLPLLVTLLAADLVSSESRAGTIKMLLTRPVARWKILAAKLGAMAIFTTLLVGAGAVLSWAIGGLAFGWAGFSAPVLTGFRGAAEGIDLSGVRVAPLWMDTLASYGLAWYGALVTGAIAVMFSVLFRSTAASLGTLAALLASGVLLGQMASDWDTARFLFTTNLPLPQFYAGVPPPVPGMTLQSAVVTLGLWGAAAVAVAVAVFERRDVTG